MSIFNSNTVNTRLQVKIHLSIEEIPITAWNSLIQEEDIPFLEWEWLAALEGSQSISPKTGWQPCHFTLWDRGKLVSAAPFYIKMDSWGEFIFDYFWAEAAGVLGRPYYPKLVGVVPASPVVGYKFLTAGGLDPIEGQRIILDQAKDFCSTRGIRGIHLLFTDPTWCQPLETQGYISWRHHHYLWENRGFLDFSDYLEGFSKNQRKNIRKERQEIENQGALSSVIPAAPNGRELFQEMFRLYSRTNDKYFPFDARFVNELFFLKLQESFSSRIFFVQTHLPTVGAAPLALAMLVQKGKKLWGRYWGTYEDIRNLHFDVCYYTPIEWAIQRGLQSFDPGAGSPHKIRRGFLAKAHTSYHLLLDPVLDSLFRSNIGRINQIEESTISELNSGSPLKVFNHAKTLPREGDGQSKTR